MFRVLHLLAALLSIAATRLAAHGQERITAPGATGVSKGRIDVDPGFAGDQVARRVSAAGNFTIAIRVYNAPSFVGFHATVHWDPAAVAFVGLSGPGMFGADLFPFPSELTASSVKVNTSVDPCGAGVSGSGTLVSLTFGPVAADRQSGFDLSAIEFSGATSPCEFPPPLIGFNATEARAVVVIGDAPISALNVNVTVDTASIGTGYNNPRCSAALGNGNISLRSAIQIANPVAGANQISFRILGGGNPTIVTTGLPALTDNSGGTHVNGSTQPGGTVEVDGASAATFTLTSPSNTIQKLAVVANPTGTGISITGNTNTVIQSLIGINAAGVASANQNGIVISGSSGSVIGGTAANANTISGNTNDGVQLTAGATLTSIRANRIGTNLAGTARIPNVGDGVHILPTAGISNTIGGGAMADRNIISGNGVNGVYIQALTNTVQGNYIGLNAAGNASLFNAGSGVLVDTAGNNTIGGAAAGQRNVISGNSTHGVHLRSGSNNVRGNYIGTNANGALPGAVPNGMVGVLVDTAALNAIGGSAAGEGNVISGNSDDGVRIDAAANGTTIQGNKIGTNAAGLAAYANGGDGVEFTATAGTGNVCGGTTAQTRNVLSGNSDNGVLIRAAVQRVIGNYIGLDAAGVGGLPNNLAGVRVENAGANEVGGGVAGEGNIIADNDSHGVELTAGATGVVVQGNRIGLDANGAAHGNGGDGVHIDATAGGGNEIGGDTTGRRNVISSNDVHGVHVQSASNTVRGNYIGTSVDGMAARGNAEEGVFIDGAANNVIGGVLSAHKNVISANFSNGVLISGVAATGNQALNNIIGLDTAGDAMLANGLSGVEINNADSNVVGAIAAGNVISGNTLDGVRIIESNLTLVRGNTIGLNQARSAARPNQDGVSITGFAASLNEIGGNIGGQGNVIAGNAIDGVYINGFGADGNLVYQNIIGTNEVFTPIPNQNDGVELSGGASQNEVIGNQIRGNGVDGVYLAGVGTIENEITSNKIGEATSPNGGNGVHILAEANENIVNANTIRFNGDNGVRIVAADMNLLTGNGIDLNQDSGVLIDLVAEGNMIGLVASPNTLLENGLDGVTIDGDSNQNFTTANTISANARDGVRVYADSIGNEIRGNLISANTALGIDLNGDGVSLNDAGDADLGGNVLQNFPVLAAVKGAAVNGTLNSTASTAFRIEFFSNAACDGSGFGEGATPLGELMVMTNALGNAVFAQPFAPALAAGTIVTATATDPVFNTSEFSLCVVIPGPGDCPGDTNGDGVVDLLDLTTLLSAFGTSSGDAAYVPEADFDDNGVIDLIDLTTLLGAFGIDCP